MKKIIAIGGAVIKTANSGLRKVILSGNVEMLIHCGGSMFHDFQMAVYPKQFVEDEYHSYTLDELIRGVYKNNDYELICEYVTNYLINNGPAPIGSVTRLCNDMCIPVLMFTPFGADFWHLHLSNYQWTNISKVMYSNFYDLVLRFKNGSFHFVNMGSAVIMPEIFIKAVAAAGIVTNGFKADVVDFGESYRARTRVAIYGSYYHMTHKQFFENWMRWGEDFDKWPKIME